MPWYHFHQNNSGGSFIGPESIYIEAESSHGANFIAGAHGIYFDGLDAGIDCDCCGDRWSRVQDWEGAPVPSRYGKPISLPAPSTVKIVPLLRGDV